MVIKKRPFFKLGRFFQAFLKAFSAFRNRHFFILQAFFLETRRLNFPYNCGIRSAGKKEACPLYSAF